MAERAAPPAGWLGRDGQPGLVSIVIPTYNQAHLIGETLASILAQTYDRIEVVVADDGSTDNTPETLAAWRERFRAERGWEFRSVRQANQGHPAARNLAARESRGAYIRFFDSDDLLPAGIVAAHERVLGTAGADLVHGPQVRFYPAREGYLISAPRAFECPDGDLLAAWLGKSRFTACACLMTRAFADRVGPWNGQLAEGLEDTEYNARCMLLAPRLAYSPEVSFLYRRHAQSLSFRTTRRGQRTTLLCMKLIEDHLSASGLLERYRKPVAAKYREFAVGAYRDGVGDVGDELVAKALAHDPDWAPARGRFKKLAFRLGGARLALRLHGLEERLEWRKWQALTGLGFARGLEPTTPVRELPLGAGAADAGAKP